MQQLKRNELEIEKQVYVAIDSKISFKRSGANTYLHYMIICSLCALSPLTKFYNFLNFTSNQYFIALTKGERAKRQHLNLFMVANFNYLIN